jgi:hypothetical protein
MTASDVDPAIITLCRLLADDGLQSQSVDPGTWDGVISTARSEGVAPLLFQRLREADCLGEIPTSARDGLEEAFYRTAAHNTLILSQLARILTALAEGVAPSVPTIVLKGAALALTVYDSIALRPMTDLDLMVPRAHVSVAMKVLHNSGYQAVERLGAGLDWSADYHEHLCGGPAGVVRVELHWGLIAGQANWRAPSIEWFWQQAEPADLERLLLSLPGSRDSVQRGDVISPQALLLGPTAHLLYIAAHFSLQHGAAEERLIWLYDIHLLVKRCADRLDWNTLISQAAEFRWSAAVYAALAAARARFGTPVSPEVLQRLDQMAHPAAVRAMERRSDPSPLRMRDVWDDIIALDWGHRWQLLWAVACPSPAFMRQRYRARRPGQWALYYPYRWYSLAKEALFTASHLVRRRDASRPPDSTQCADGRAQNVAPDMRATSNRQPE